MVVGNLEGGHLDKQRCCYGVLEEDVGVYGSGYVENGNGWFGGIRRIHRGWRGSRGVLVGPSGVGWHVGKVRD